MPTSDVLARVEAALVEHFGHRPARASVSFVGVDPIEVLRFEPIPGERAYISLGMSRHPMTGAAESVQALDGPRAELMLHVRDPGDRFADVWRRVALLAATPAVEGVVYADGLSVDVGEPLVPASRCTGVVVGASAVAPVVLDDAGIAGDATGITGDATGITGDATGITGDGQRVPSDDHGAGGGAAARRVDVWQVVPATSAELAWCRVRGSDELRERWARAGTDLLDLERSGVALGD